MEGFLKLNCEEDEEMEEREARGKKRPEL